MAIIILNPMGCCPISASNFPIIILLILLIPQHYTLYAYNFTEYQHIYNNIKNKTCQIIQP